MSKQLSSLLIISFLILGFSNSSFKSINETVNSDINERHDLRLDDLLRTALHYQQSVRRKNKKQIIEAHRLCRNAYKRTEHLLNYWDRSFIKLNINGAPLPTLTTERKEVIVHEPEGLQILDELLFETELDFKTIEVKINNLVENLYTIYPHERKRTFTDQSVLEGIRNQIIRVITLSITGFDTPGSLNGLEESMVSLDAMQCDLESYSISINDKASVELKNCIHLASAAKQFILDNNDFENLDRTELVREFLDPLYTSVLDFQLAQKIQIRTEESEYDKSISFRSRSLFSESLLNPYYYTGLKENDDNLMVRELGAYLFYDKALSSDNNMSCASCHNPDKAFTDGLNKSISSHGDRTVKRNSPTLINSIYSTRFFYDLRAQRLESQVLDVINSTDEFNVDIETIITKLESSPEYVELFDKAFDHLEWKSETISSYKIVAALSSYVLSLRSQNSTFDRYMRKEISDIDSEVIEGFSLFMGKAACATCHFPPHFNGLVPDEYHENESEVLGVPSDPSNDTLDSDIGRIGNKWWYEEAEHFRHSFKTVGLRNVQLTGPYMHNGVFESLEEVVAFYDEGGGEGRGLEVPFQTLGSDPLNLSDAEKQSLISFMEALTDTSFKKMIPKSLPKFEGELSKLNRTVKY